MQSNEKSYTFAKKNVMKQLFSQKETALASGFLMTKINYIYHITHLVTVLLYWFVCNINLKKKNNKKF